MLIRQIFISPGHNYFGHHGRAPDDYPLVEVQKIECVAGHGIRGDRFYDYRDDYKGQITFFSFEVFERLAGHFGLTDKSAGAVRRNVVVSGADLNELIGQEFSIQGIRLLGTAHCRPCYWLDQAIAPGAEKFLEGNGGLRAQILSDGVIAVGDAELVLAEPRLNISDASSTVPL
jgi:MOSC domain-containing protein YiiM